jgi:hypothetical protein
MLTIAEKLVGILTIVALDVSILLFGGLLFAFAALLATMPLTVSLIHR